MQKALTLMNVQLANAIADLSGQTGMAILAIRERNPWTLAKLRDPRIQASEEEIAHSLQGNWREDVLFELEQVLAAYDFQLQQIEKCEQQLEKYMKAQPTRPAVGPVLSQAPPGVEEAPKKNKKKARNTKPPRKNCIGFDLETELARVMGADLTVIDGIKLMTVQTIYSELGPDLSAFPSENHFASWLMLAPKRDVSGGKVIRHVWVKGRNRVANALRMAAETLKNSQSYLGAAIDLCVGDWEPRKPSKPWPVIWHAWSIACSQKDKIGLTVALLITSNDGNNANSSIYNTRPKLWDFNWFLPSNIKTTSQERRQIVEVSSESAEPRRCRGELRGETCFAQPAGRRVVELGWEVMVVGCLVPLWLESMTSVAAKNCLVASRPEKGQARPRQ